MAHQVTLFKALRSAKVSSDDATQVVEELESHIAMKITEANAALVGEIKGMREGLDAKVNSIRWMLAFSITLSVIATALGGYVAAIQG